MANSTNAKTTSRRSAPVVITSKTPKSQKQQVLCDNPECDMCTFLARLWRINRKTK